MDSIPTKLSAILKERKEISIKKTSIFFKKGSKSTSKAIFVNLELFCLFTKEVCLVRSPIICSNNLSGYMVKAKGLNRKN